MKILIYSIKDFEHYRLMEAIKNGLQVQLTHLSLSGDTAGLAKGFDVVSVFTGDDVIRASHSKVIG
ncbi:MAG: hypothetical protein WDO19_26720 [Bacteroidota bacterium]